MSDTATSPKTERNVTLKVYHVKCAACQKMFESVSPLARTCQPACRQKKHREEKRTAHAKLKAVMDELVRLARQMAAAGQLLRQAGLPELGDDVDAAVAKIGELDA